MYTLFCRLRNHKNSLSGQQGVRSFATSRQGNPFVKYQWDAVKEEFLVARARKLPPEMRDQSNRRNGGGSGLHCLMTLSAGQHYHHDMYLGSALAFVRQHFDKVTFVIGDSLQRSTLALTQRGAPEELAAVATALGDQWIHRNVEMLGLLDIPWGIIRWNQWLSDPMFPRAHKAVAEGYAQDPKYRAAFDENVQKFCSAYKSARP